MTHGSLVITGVEGFVGSHLARLAAAEGLSVIGMGRADAPSDALGGVLSAYHRVDLRDDLDIDIPAPRAVVHLAARAAVGPSFDHPKVYAADNTAMTVSVGEWMLGKGWTGTRLVMVSTGAVYGSRTVPIAEDAPLDASSPYVVSKVASELFVDYYARRGLDAVVMRPFNHIGPGQGRGFLIPDLVEKVLAAQAGVISTGNLSTRRDYTDVRDVARAYLSAATAPELRRRVYNVGSGVSRSGEDILAVVLECLGIERTSIRVQQQALRPLDVPEVTADASALRHDFGWTPDLPLERSIGDYIRARA